MNGVLLFIEKVSKSLQIVSITALTFIMLLTVTDVVGRWFGHPVDGTFEMVGLAGAVVIAFAIPVTSWMRGHIYVDFLYQKLSKRARNVLHICTRLIVIITFSLIGWNLFKLAYKFYISGEVTPTRLLPFYPIAYGLGICCLIQCLVAGCEIIKIKEGTYE
jgi:TRAP-type C4-dicarboxylate transport system permease small subunit